MEAFGLLMHGFAVLLAWKTLLLMMVGLVLGIFVAIMFVTFDVAFDVIMPKGPLEAAFGR